MASVNPSDLLTHANWLRQLARSLVREGADDLVQETWVAALRHPPRSEGSARPWLRRVLTNAARLRWRGDANRTAREHAAAALDDREVPSAAELLDRHELRQLLARLVSELAEPFRSTVLLRFGEGLEPTEIARRLGVPPGTVRWRLKEALDRLRSELDALHRGDRKKWVLALTPLLAPRSPAVASTMPWLLVMVGIGAACTVLALVLLGHRGSAPVPAPPARAGSPTMARPSSPAEARRAAWLAQEGAPPRALRGHVRTSDGAPVIGVAVHLLASPLAPREIVTDDHGRFDFGEQPAREYSLGAASPGKLAAIQHVDLRAAGLPPDVELVLGDCTASLYGTVTDASATPIQGAQVLREGVVGTETDAHGAYELCTLPTAALVAELRVVVHADGFGTIAVPLAAPGRMRRDFVLAPEASIAGRVLGVDGTPIADARVWVSLTTPEAALPPERGYAISDLTDADGAFRFRGLAAGEHRLRASSASAMTAEVSLSIEAAEARILELRAQATGTLRGRVVTGGTPIGGVTIAAGDEVAVSQPDGSFVLARVPVGDIDLTTAPYRRTSGAVAVVAGDQNTTEISVEPLGTIRGTIRRHGRPVPYARIDIAGPSKAGLTSDAAGRYEAKGLEAGTYGFYCDDRQRGAMFAEERVFELGAGETRERDIELAWGGTIAGHVVDRVGAPVVGASVLVQGESASQCITDASGAFACGGLPGGSYSTSVLPSTGAANAFRFLEPPATLELRDGDTRVDDTRLVVDATILAIDGRVVNGAGLAVSDVAVHAFASDQRRRSTFQPPLGTVTDADGRFHIAGLAPGPYILEVERRDLGRRVTAAAGDNVTLVLDRSPCDGANAHDVPPILTKPAARVVWDDRIELVGWSVPTPVRAGTPIDVTYVFRALQPISRDWTVFAHFDATRRVSADHDPALGWCPTKLWTAGETIVDRSTVRFDQPGRYSLTIGFFTGKAPSWENLPLSTMPGQHGARIGEVNVSR